MKLAGQSYKFEVIFINGNSFPSSVDFGINYSRPNHSQTFIRFASNVDGSKVDKIMKKKWSKGGLK